MRIIYRLPPIIFACLLLVAMFFGMFLLAYLFLIAAVAGLVFYLYNWIRLRFTSPKKTPQRPSGRIIDSDDWRKL